MRQARVAIGHQRQHRLDQRLAVGPRHQHGRRDLERQAPELALAQDVGHRLAPHAPRRERTQPSRRRRQAPSSVPRATSCSIERPVALRQQQAGLEAGVVDAGRGQRDGGVAQQRVVGSGQAASSASRDASSSAISASMISSSPRPSITSSSL